MAWERKLPPDINQPSLSGSVMVDTWRGKLRVRAWPRKRGRKQTYKQKYLTDRFAEAAKLCKYCAVMEYERAVELAHGTGVYPQDLLRSNMCGGNLRLEDEDGTVWQKYIPWIEPVAFQGARLLRTSDLTVAGGVTTAIPWQNPILDTGAFWNAGTPTRLTIPEKVTVVSLDAALLSFANVSGQFVAFIEKNGSQRLTQAECDTSGGDGVSVSTGPVPVVEGDFFEVYCVCTNTRALDWDFSNFFGLTVLGAS